MTIRSLFSRARRFIDSKPLTAILIVLVALLAIIIIFEAGMLFGMREARHSYRWGEAYDRNFGGPTGGFLGPRQAAMPNGHGDFGRIASTSFPTFIITDPARPEERIRIQDDTVIRNGTQTASSSALTVGTYVVVLGTPSEDGIINANLIRIMPEPPQSIPR